MIIFDASKSSIKWEHAQWDYKLVKLLENKIQEDFNTFIPL